MQFDCFFFLVHPRHRVVCISKSWQCACHSARNVALATLTVAATAVRPHSVCAPCFNLERHLAEPITPCCLGIVSQ